MSLDQSLLTACWSSSFPADEVGGILFCKTAHSFKPTGSVITEWHIFFLWSISHFLAAVIEVTKRFSSLRFFWFVFVCLFVFLWCPESELHIWHILWDNIKTFHTLHSKIQGDWRMDSPSALREDAKVGNTLADHPHMIVLVRCLFERAPCSLRSCQPLWAQPPSLPQLPLPLPDPAAESHSLLMLQSNNILLLSNPILHLHLPAKSPTPAPLGTFHWSWLKCGVTTIMCMNSACTAKRNFCPPCTPSSPPSQWRHHNFSLSELEAKSMLYLSKKKKKLKKSASMGLCKTPADACRLNQACSSPHLLSCSVPCCWVLSCPRKTLR